MNKKMSDRLGFRRQFIITKVPTKYFPEWNCYNIGPFFLYAHPDIEVSAAIDESRSIHIIGCIFDPAFPEKSNKEIIEEILERISSKESLFLYVKRYVGRFIIIYTNEGRPILFSDALALREVYYCKKDNIAICASQPNLIAEYVDHGLQLRADKDFMDYYNSHSMGEKWNHKYKWIGDDTIYNDIQHLLPNHYLEIISRKTGRYWPNQPIKRIELKDAIIRSCDYLRGSLTAFANRHKLMMAVTSGIDSRTLLAATRRINKQIYMFINNHGLGVNHPDIKISKDMLSSLGISFHIHDVPLKVEKNFQEIFFKNTFFASGRILPAIYNIYFLNHSDKVNVIGIGEIGRTRFGREPRKLTAFRLSYKMKVIIGKYTLEQGRKILEELAPIGKIYSINVLTLLYWEHWLGNWGAVGNSESDIAIEELNPFDSHMLYEILLGVDEKHRNYDNPLIFKEMIQYMWPELINWPFNPPYRTQDKISRLLKEIGLYEIIREAKYQVAKLCYQLKLFLNRVC